MTAPPFEVDRAHRWFAVELNNLAWELIELPQRTADEAQRMIHAAHASYWHWLQVGSTINHQRALCLLATAYGAAGDGPAAVRYALQCTAMSEQTGDDQTPFDRATASGCAARAHALAGAAEDAAAWRDRAREAFDELDDPDEKRVVAELYGEH